MFSLGIFGGEPRHIRRARAYLQEARMSMLEHSIAAEHYQASAAMYADRVRRLEEEIAQWSATRNGAELMEALPELPTQLVDTARIESTKKTVGKDKAPVGIVRAA